MPPRVENLARGDLHAELGGGQAQGAQTLDQLGLRHDAGPAPRQFAFDPFVNIDHPAGPAQQQPAQQAAHRAPDDDRAACFRSGQGVSPIFKSAEICYI